MPSIALIMRRKPLAEGISRALEEEADGLETYIITNYRQASAYISRLKPATIVFEIAEPGTRDAQYSLELSGKIKRLAPGCKLLLIYPEADQENLKSLIQDKRSGMIDDFVSYDTSLNYLVSKILAM